MSEQPDHITEDGWLSHPHDLPAFNAAETAAERARVLYDSLERLAREARAGTIKDSTLQHADEALALARKGVE